MKSPAPPGSKILPPWMQRNWSRVDLTPPSLHPADLHPAVSGGKRVQSSVWVGNRLTFCQEANGLLMIPSITLSRVVDGRTYFIRCRGFESRRPPKVCFSEFSFAEPKNIPECFLSLGSQEMEPLGYHTGISDRYVGQRSPLAVSLVMQMHTR